MFNRLNADLNPICHLLALLAHHHFHVGGSRVNIIKLCYSISLKRLFFLVPSVSYIHEDKKKSRLEEDPRDSKYWHRSLTME